MSIHTGTFYFSKNIWCGSVGYTCCNRVVVSPRDQSYKAGDIVRLRYSNITFLDRVRPEEYYSGELDIQATVLAVEHYASPSQTMLFLGPPTSLNGAPLWMHTNDLNYSEIDYVSPCYFPYGFDTPYGLAFVGNGLDVLAIFRSGSVAVEFDFIITIDGSGYSGSTVRVKTLCGPGYSSGGSEYSGGQQGNVFTGRVTRNGSYKTGEAIFVGVTFEPPYPTFSSCRFQLSNIKFANCRGELFDMPTYTCIMPLGYFVTITKQS